MPSIGSVLGGLLDLNAGQTRFDTKSVYWKKLLRFWSGKMPHARKPDELGSSIRVCGNWLFMP